MNTDPVIAKVRMYSGSHKPFDVFAEITSPQIDSPFVFATARTPTRTVEVRARYPEGAEMTPALLAELNWYEDVIGRFGGSDINAALPDLAGADVAKALQAAGIAPTRALVLEIQAKRLAALEAFDAEWLATEAKQKANS